MSSRSIFRVLVVDDLSDNLFLLQTILESEGYEVDTAENGEIALAKVRERPPDLILMDVMMPDMNGYDITCRIRRDASIPFMPILMVTAHEEASEVQGLALGANDFIRKPIDFEQLLARVASFLHFSQCASSR